MLFKCHTLVSLHPRTILSPFTKGFRGEGHVNESGLYLLGLVMRQFEKQRKARFQHWLPTALTAASDAKCVRAFSSCELANNLPVLQCR